MTSSRSKFTSGTRACLAALALSTLALLLTASPASADLSFCPLGSGAGQCAAPQRIGAQRGLAADAESGRLYVADEGNNRIDVFKEDGKFLFAFGWGVADGTTNAPQTCTTTCFKGISGSGSGQFDRPTSVAVDNDPASPSHHAIYIGETGNFRVQKLDPTGAFVWTIGKGVNKTTSANLCTAASGNTCGAGAESEAAGGFASAPFVAVGPAGVLYAVDNVRPSGDVIQQRLQRFEPAGAPISPPVTLLEGNLTLVRAIAVDAAGNLWVTGQGTGLRKYSPTGTPLAGPFEPGANFAGGLAVDAGGDVYAAQEEKGSFNVVAAFHPTGALFRRFAYTVAQGGIFGNSINGLAAHTSASGEFFFSQRNGGITYVFEPPPGPVAAPPSLEAKGIGSTKATLIAEVNPEGKATEAHFEYVDEAAYLKDIGELGAGHGFDHAESSPTAPLGAAGFELKKTEAQIGCPNPATEAGEPGNDCLTPGTTYRWRVVASNADGGGEGPVEGPPFTTNESLELGEIWATGVGTDTARLNGEAKPNAIPATGFFEYVEDAAYQEDVGEGGDGFAAATKAPAGAPLDFGAGEVLTTQQVAIYPLDPGTVYHYRLVVANPLLEKASEAEELRTFEPSESEPCPANEASRIGPGALLPDCRAYEMVSPLDKDGGDIRVLETTLSRPAVLEQAADSGEGLAYGSLRSFGDAASAPFTSQYIAQRIAGEEWKTHSINPPRGRQIYGSLAQFDSEFKAFSTDLCEGWITTFAEPPLGEGALAGYPNLYRRTDELCGEDGEARYEALAPISEPPDIAGESFFMAPLGVSADGAEAIFTTNGKLAANGSKEQIQLYESAAGESPRLVCILPDGKALKTPCTAGTNALGGPGTQIGRISSDGERIFWTDSNSGEGKLYVRVEGTQTLAVSKAAEEESGTSKSRFWGAAADGSVAIFTTGNMVEGKAKLYSFTLEGQTTTPIAEGLYGVMGISEDAGRIYFASSKVLAPGAVEGKPNLYLHEAGEGGGSTELVATLASADLAQAVLSEQYRGHTSRVSPDGAHAAFTSVAPLTAYDNTEGGTACGDTVAAGNPCTEVYRYDAGANELSCVSCNPSGARPAGPASIPFWQTGMHAARVLSDDGARLYFESADALTPRDANGRADVYQWEEEGAGGCEEEDPAFSPSAGGCVGLISSGQSKLNSRFVEASPSGDDVFFATGSSLLPQDYGLVDIYDARVGGGLPIPAPPAPGCEGEACQSPPEAPNDPTPASSSFEGAGNVVEGTKPRCAKGKVRRRGRCVPRKHRKAAQRAKHKRRDAR
jgi:hypothetical protein